MVRSILTAFFMTCCVLGQVSAQTATVPGPSPAAPVVAGIQSINIMEVKPDASTEPGYATQNNGERAKVQPGNNAPLWRCFSAT